MGMINYNPELTDDYSSEVIRLARERSPATDAWIVEQRYLQETPEENLSPLWLRNRCVIRICDELAEMGVRLHRDPDLICDEPEMVYAVLMLRKKFDPENLFVLFRGHPDLVVEVCGDFDVETLLNIINWCKDNLPLDEGWGLLSNVLENHPDVFDGEDQRFLALVTDVLDRLDQLGEPDATSEVDQDLMLKYITILGKRADCVRETAYLLWANSGETEYARTARKQLIDRQMQHYETHLGSRTCLVKVLPEFETVNLHGDLPLINFLTKIRAPYKQLWPSCLDFYCGEEVKPCTDCELAIILATFIVDAPHRSVLRQHVMHELNEYLDRLGESAVEAIQLRFNDMLVNLVNPLEINYAS